MGTLTAFATAGLAFACLACGVRLGAQSGPDNRPASDPSARYIEGNFRDLNQAQISLGDYKSKTLIVIFASDTCEVCASEVEEIKSSLREPDRAPSKVEILSLLLGADVQDARDWRNSHSIPWRVGYLDALGLFRQWCPGGQVPCVIVQRPERGIVLQRASKVSVAELHALTGDWEEAL
jgi:hypothetical protein